MSANSVAEETQRPAGQRHLFLKGLAGLLLGFPISLWISWLVMYTGLGPSMAPARDQVAMWLVVPLWAAALSMGFLAPTLTRCVVWFLAANAVVGALWWAMQ